MSYANHGTMGLSRDIGRLIEIMAALRTPGSGCPWDLEQTFATIAPYTLEEAYEVADAIARGDLTTSKDELGDLLLQVVFHARMAQEQGAFDFGDVVEAITAKLVRRHPHVFARRARQDRRGGQGPVGADQGRGERGRAAREQSPRRRARRRAGRPARANPRAEAAEQRPAKSASTGTIRAPCCAKIREEADEIEAALDAQDKVHAAAEVGDLLFAVVNLARHLDADPEGSAARDQPEIRTPLRLIERALAARGKTPAGRNPRRNGCALGRGEGEKRRMKLVGRYASALRRAKSGSAEQTPQTSAAPSRLRRGSARTVMPMRPVRRRTACAALRYGGRASSAPRRRPDRARVDSVCRLAASRVSIAAAERIDPLAGHRRHQHRPALLPAAARRD